MAWPYQFIHGDAALRQTRRALLDRYALYAQVSLWALILLALLARLTQYVVQRSTVTAPYRGPVYAAVPASPTAKPRERAATAWISVRLRRALWWLSDTVQLSGWSLGRRDVLIVGGAWAVWLLLLCVNNSGNGTSE